MDRTRSGYSVAAAIITLSSLFPASHQATCEPPPGLQQLDALLRARKYPEAEVGYRRLAEANKADKFLAARCWLSVAKCQASARRTEESNQSYEKIASEFPDQGYYAATALLRLATFHGSTVKKEYEKAIGLLQKPTKAYPDQEYQVVTALGLMATHYKALKKPEEAIKTYEVMIEKYGHWRAKAADAWYQVGYTFQGIGKTEKAIVAYQTAVRDYPEVLATVKTCLTNIGTLYIREGEFGLAREAYQQLLEKLSDDATSCSSAHLGIARAHAKEGNCDEAVRWYLDYLLQFPTNLTGCGTALTELTDLLILFQRYDEALQVAKVHYGIAGNDERSLTAGVNLVMRALKSKERTLSAVNEFVDFQEFGPRGRDDKPGTEDDLRNPMKEVRLNLNEKRQERLKKAIAVQCADLEGEKTKGYLYLLHDMPVEALDCFKRVYALSAVRGTALNIAVQELVRVTRALHGHAHLSQTVVDNLNYGMEGKDGRKGTPDDVVDPFVKGAIPPARPVETEEPAKK